LAVQYGGNITTLSTTKTVADKGTYYVWVRAGNSKGYSDDSSPATANVTALDPIVGTSWTVIRDDGSVTLTFNDDGTLTRDRRYDDGDGYSDTYNYNSATKRIYYQWGNPPELYGTYSYSGSKLTITESNTNSYTRRSGSSGLIGAWRQSYSDGNYDEYEFASGGKVFERELWYDELDEEEYSYTVSGSKIKFSEKMPVAELSEGKLYVNMGGDEPIPFTRQSGSGVAGTWKAGEGEEAVTLVITSSKITLSGAQSGEYPCSIEGNNLFITNTWEASFIIDTSGGSDVLTLTEEWTETYNKVTK
jgi:hypothetical protein